MTIAGTVACLLTMRANPLWCTSSSTSNFLLAQFPAGLRGGRKGLSSVRNRCFGRLPHSEKKSGWKSSWGRSSCALDSSTGKETAGNGPKKAVGIPVLDRDDKGNIVIRQAKLGESICFGPAENGAPLFKPSSINSNLSREDSTIAKSSRGPGTSKPREKSERSEKPRGKPVGRENLLRPQASKIISSFTSKEVSTNLKRATPVVKATAGAPQYSKAARRFYNKKFREPERLAKVLAAAGVASRRGSEEIIFEGRVSVNGKVCKVPQTPVDHLKDIIYVDGNSLPKKMATKMYFALNKPKGYICSSGEEGTKPVLSIFNDYFKVWEQRNPGLSRPRMFTVGRLDVATSGLLLVTNDGEFANKVSHPSSGLTKEYVVTVNEKITRRQLATIGEGTLVQGVKCVPTLVEAIDMEAGETRQRIRVVVSEGRNHEVRQLVENAGLQVLALKRVRIGGLRLSRKLTIGAFKELTEPQIAKVLDKNLQNTV